MESDEMICPACEGTGEESCSECGGDGNCNHCGEGACPECSGAGDVDCTECDGAKVVERL